MKQLAFTAVIILTLCGSIFGQAKVGTSGPQFLNLIPTVRAQGTGTSAILYNDPSGHFFNPAYLTSRPQHMLGLSYLDMPAGVDFYGGAAAIGLDRRNGRSWHVAYSLRYLSSDDLVETTYDQGTFDGTSRTVGYDGYEHRLVIAYAADVGPILSAGVAIKWIREEVHDYRADGYAFDIGISISQQIRLRDSLQVTVFGSSTLQNFGPDYTIIENSYPLPQLTSVGGGATLAVRRDGMSLVETTPIVELVKEYEVNTYVSAGVEAGLFESVYARVGQFGRGNSRTVYGFGLSTAGLQKQLFGHTSARSGFFRWLAANLTVRYDKAFRSYGVLLDEPYSLSITL